METTLILVQHDSTSHNVAVYEGISPLEVSRLIKAAFGLKNEYVIGLKHQENHVVVPLSLVCGSPDKLMPGAFYVITAEQEISWTGKSEKIPSKHIKDTFLREARDQRERIDMLFPPFKYNPEKSFTESYKNLSWSNIDGNLNIENVVFNDALEHNPLISSANIYDFKETAESYEQEEKTVEGLVKFVERLVTFDLISEKEDIYLRKMIEERHIVLMEAFKIGLEEEDAELLQQLLKGIVAKYLSLGGKKAIRVQTDIINGCYSLEKSGHITLQNRQKLILLNILQEATSCKIQLKHAENNNPKLLRSYLIQLEQSKFFRSIASTKEAIELVRKQHIYQKNSIFGWDLIEESENDSEIDCENDGDVIENRSEKRDSDDDSSDDESTLDDIILLSGIVGYKSSRGEMTKKEAKLLAILTAESDGHLGAALTVFDYEKDYVQLSETVMLVIRKEMRERQKISNNNSDLSSMGSSDTLILESSKSGSDNLDDDDSTQTHDIFPPKFEYLLKIALDWMRISIREAFLLRCSFVGNPGFVPVTDMVRATFFSYRQGEEERCIDEFISAVRLVPEPTQLIKRLKDHDISIHKDNAEDDEDVSTDVHNAEDENQFQIKEQRKKFGSSYAFMRMISKCAEALVESGKITESEAKYLLQFSPKGEQVIYASLESYSATFNLQDLLHTLEALAHEEFRLANSSAISSSTVVSESSTERILAKNTRKEQVTDSDGEINVNDAAKDWDIYYKNIFGSKKICSEDPVNQVKSKVDKNPSKITKPNIEQFNIDVVSDMVILDKIKCVCGEIKEDASASRADIVHGMYINDDLTGEQVYYILAMFASSDTKLLAIFDLYDVCGDWDDFLHSLITLVNLKDPLHEDALDCKKSENINDNDLNALMSALKLEDFEMDELNREIELSDPSLQAALGVLEDDNETIDDIKGAMTRFAHLLTFDKSYSSDDESNKAISTENKFREKQGVDFFRGRRLSAFRSLLEVLTDRNLLSKEAANGIDIRMAERDPVLLGTLDAYRSTNDFDDLVDTMKRLK